MTNQDNHEATAHALDRLAAEQRSENVTLAADAARAFLEALTRETGLPAKPGTLEALAWEVLRLLNQRVDADCEQIRHRLSGGALH